MKKTLVLFTLFIVPIVVYLVFTKAIHTFGKLPILVEKVQEIGNYQTKVRFDGKITILGFLGEDLSSRQTNALTLNQKIYRRYYEFNDFQMVMVVPKGLDTEVNQLKAELSKLADIKNWHFVFMTKNQINELYQSLNTPEELQADLGTHKVFIIDKSGNLRGRDDDEEVGIKHGYDATSVAEINNKMLDDVKVILAEYRLALKKNNATRSK